MTAALVEGLVAAPVHSLEVRWITPGPLGTAMREWFARFPAGTETREDAYLLQPRLQGLSGVRPAAAGRARTRSG